MSSASLPRARRRASSTAGRTRGSSSRSIAWRRPTLVSSPRPPRAEAIAERTHQTGSASIPESTSAKSARSVWARAASAAARIQGSALRDEPHEPLAQRAGRGAGPRARAGPRGARRRSRRRAAPPPPASLARRRSRRGRAARRAPRSRRGRGRGGAAGRPRRRPRARRGRARRARASGDRPSRRRRRGPAGAPGSRGASRPTWPPTSRSAGGRRRGGRGGRRGRP